MTDSERLNKQGHHWGKCYYLHFLGNHMKLQTCLNNNHALVFSCKAQLRNKWYLLSIPKTEIGGGQSWVGYSTSVQFTSVLTELLSSSDIWSCFSLAHQTTISFLLKSCHCCHCDMTDRCFLSLQLCILPLSTHRHVHVHIHINSYILCADCSSPRKN